MILPTCVDRIRKINIATTYYNNGRVIYFFSAPFISADLDFARTAERNNRIVLCDDKKYVCLCITTRLYYIIAKSGSTAEENLRPHNGWQFFFSFLWPRLWVIMTLCGFLSFVCLIRFIFVTVFVAFQPDHKGDVRSSYGGQSRRTHKHNKRFTRRKANRS